MARDRSQASPSERLLHHYRQICTARNNETMRVADLIEQAIYAAESDETQEALLNLATKVLKP